MLFRSEEWYLVDLPGYGYASVTRSKHRSWGSMIETYLKKRDNLITTFVLLDPRHDPQKIDLEFIAWMGQEGLPFSLVFTKADKLSKNHLMIAKKKWETKLEETWSELPPIFLTSSEERKGKEDLLSYIKTLLTKN